MNQACSRSFAFNHAATAKHSESSFAEHSIKKVFSYPFSSFVLYPLQHTTSQFALVSGLAGKGAYTSLTAYAMHTLAFKWHSTVKPFVNQLQPRSRATNNVEMDWVILTAMNKSMNDSLGLRIEL